MKNVSHHAKALLGANSLADGLVEEVLRLSNELALQQNESKDHQKEIDSLRSKKRSTENTLQMVVDERDHLQRVIDSHESEDAQAIDLLRKARQTIGINPEGARNLIDQAVAILNPPDAPAPF